MLARNNLAIKKPSGNYIATFRLLGRKNDSSREGGRWLQGKKQTEEANWKRIRGIGRSQGFGIPFWQSPHPLYTAACCCSLAVLWLVTYTEHQELSQIAISRARYSSRFDSIWRCVGDLDAVLYVGSLRWHSILVDKPEKKSMLIDSSPLANSQFWESSIVHCPYTQGFSPFPVGIAIQ